MVGISPTTIEIYSLKSCGVAQPDALRNLSQNLNKKKKKYWQMWIAKKEQLGSKKHFFDLFFLFKAFLLHICFLFF